jgi:hypothetical protein
VEKRRVPHHQEETKEKINILFLNVLCIIGDRRCAKGNKL